MRESSVTIIEAINQIVTAALTDPQNSGWGKISLVFTISILGNLYSCHLNFTDKNRYLIEHLCLSTRPHISLGRVHLLLNKSEVLTRRPLRQTSCSDTLAALSVNFKHQHQGQRLQCVYWPFIYPPATLFYPPFPLLPPLPVFPHDPPSSISLWAIYFFGS